ncbi:hypothetical protein Plo01_75270 [Planobispora longispora]|uniref:Uncharacterized protein n=1 Tax=Planobispora longispora TaxID=28887 RepID=A0A8J3RTY7_9ACTN|nr:hypothetical protein Plo01_75270 [Planobispora longispora]
MRVVPVLPVPVSFVSAVLVVAAVLVLSAVPRVVVLPVIVVLPLVPPVAGVCPVPRVLGALYRFRHGGRLLRRSELTCPRYTPWGYEANELSEGGVIRESAIGGTSVRGGGMPDRPCRGAGGGRIRPVCAAWG